MADPHKQSPTYGSTGYVHSVGSEGQADELGTAQFRGTRYTFGRAAFDRPDAEAQKAELAARLRATDARGAPLASTAGLGSASFMTGARVDTGREDEFRARQQALAGQLGEMAEGRGPSAAGMQLQAGLDKALMQQMSAAGSAQGNVNPALAMRSSLQQGAGMAQDVQQQMAQARVQEQMGALGQLGGVVAAGRGADQATALAQAGFGQQASAANQAAFNQFAMQRAAMGQQTNLANQAAQLQTMGLNDAQARAYMAQKLGISESELNASMAREKLAVEQNLAQQGLDFQAYQAASKARRELFGGVMKTAGALATLSDEAKKASVSESPTKLRGFLGALKSGDGDDGEGGDDLMDLAAMKGAAGAATSRSPVEAKKHIEPGGRSLANFHEALKGQDTTGSPWGDAAVKGAFATSERDIAEAQRAFLTAGIGELAKSPIEAKKDVTPAGERLSRFYSVLAADDDDGRDFGDVMRGIALKYRADKDAAEEADRKKSKVASSRKTAPASAAVPTAAPAARRDPIEVMDKVDRERELAKRLKAEEDKILFRSPPGDWTRPEAAASPTAAAWPGGAPLLAGNPAWGETTGLTPTPDTSGKDAAAAIEAQARLLNAASPPSPMSGPSLGQYQQALGLRRADAPRSPTWAVSDRDAKRSVGSEASREAFLDALQAHEYSYKDPDAPGAGHGRFVSPMAQELEKTSLGRSAVLETPEGKMVDYGKLGGIMLASQADLHHRMADLEAALNKRRASARKAA